MKVLYVRSLIERGPLSGDNGEWRRIEAEIVNAISHVVHPLGAGAFRLNPTRKGNGVITIKAACMRALQELHGWRLERRVAVGEGIGAGPIDAVRETLTGRPFAVEWETGNISSSHRSLNKMALGIIQNRLAGGAIIVPSKDMYPYLTDRVGNVRELEPYYPLWRSISGDGVLAVIVVEHDALDPQAPLLAKMTDGMYAFGRARADQAAVQPGLLIDPED